MKILTLILLLSFVLPLFALAQKNKTDTSKTDTAKFNQRVNNLAIVKNGVDSLIDNKNILQRSQEELTRKIAALNAAKRKGQTLLNEIVQLTANKKRNADALTRTNLELQTQTRAYRDTLAKVQKDVARLDSARAKFQQDTTDLRKNITKLKGKSDSVGDELVKRQAAVAQQLDSLEVVAVIEMNNVVHVHKKGPGHGFNARVQSVHLLVKEGMLLEIVAVTDSGTFRNKAAIVDLLHFGSRGGDHLQYENQRYRRDHDSLYVFLDDVIKYTPMRSYSDLPYSDFDITLTPTKDKRTYLLRESTSINSYFNIAAFTDIKGISGEPNGLAQFAAEAKFITNTRNFKNSSLVYFNSISFIGGLSKYDSKFKGTGLLHHDSVSRRDLFQRSNYSVGVKMNLLRAFASPYPHHLFSDMQLNIGYNFVGSKVADTTFRDLAKTIIDTTYRTVTQNEIYLEPMVTLSRHRNFSLILSLPLHMVSLKESEGLSNTQREFWASPSINLMYYGKRETGNKLFFRYQHFINLGDNKQAFSQMQLGYAVNLTSVWNNK